MADSQDTRTLPLSRRSLLASGTAALTITPYPHTPDDPVLPLYKTWVAEMHNAEALVELWSGDLDDDPVETQLIAADFRCDHAAKRLLSTRPTTLAGLTAKLRCVRSRLECRDDEPLLDALIGDVKALDALYGLAPKL